MLDLRSTPVTRALLPFSAGCYAGFRATGTISATDSYSATETCSASGVFSAEGILLLCLLVWILAAGFFRLSRRGSRHPAFCFATLSFLLFLSLGFGWGRASWKEDPQLPEGKEIVVQGILREGPVERGDFHTFDLQVRMVHDGDNARKTNTILKVYLHAGGDSRVPAAGESVMLCGHPYPVRNSGNPGDPDFESIFHRQNIWYRFYAKPLPGTARAVPLPAACRIRNLITEQWRGDEQEIGLLRAVCLGERSGLTDELRHSYSLAGGMHLLAVSGLHVGLIWWALRYLFSWMMVLPGGAFFRSLCVVTLLWFYAFVTGFAPPVCRSVIMFTLITGSRLLDHRTHPVNSILVSAFLLLIADPGWITWVGFQLSYTAILGISLLYRPLTRFLHPANRLLAYIWQAMAISFSAQIATAPLVIYYFHQLPVYSLVTSLFAVPLLSCLIALFVISVPFAFLGILPGMLNLVMMELAGWMNRFMGFVASIPGGVVDEIYLDPPGLVFSMALVVIVISAVISRRAGVLNALLLVASAMLLHATLKLCGLKNSSEMVVAHFNRGSLVTFREGLRADHYIYCTDTITAVRILDYLDHTWMNEPMDNSLFRMLDPDPLNGSISCCRTIAPGIRFIGNDHLSLLVVSGSKIALKGELHGKRRPDFILLCNGAGNRGSLPPGAGNRGSLPPGAGNRGSLPPGTGNLIIIDGSNTRPEFPSGNRVAIDGSKTWPIHYTGERGAFSHRW